MRATAIHICFGGPERTLVVGGVSILFEDHHYFGPMPLNRRTGAGRELAASHPFWRAAALWYEQGEQLDKHGVCVWSRTAPKTPKPAPNGGGHGQQRIQS